MEREWWLMRHLNLGFNDIESMPWDQFEWFHDRHVQHLIDLQKKQQMDNNG
jgi:predicted protein tyrosine phosphatase